MVQVSDTQAWQAPVRLCIWRHPRPQGAVGRCIGRTDLPVDRRKAKRLAHRIRRHARQQRWPRVVHTSPLARSVAVGRWLARWGWQHHIDTALSELDFGAWDGQRWDDIDVAAIEAWCRDLAHDRGHGGESVAALFERCARWLDSARMSEPRCVVGHAGWMNAAQRLCRGEEVPQTARQWPAAPSYGRRLELR